jgi:hypothetical protein
MRTWSAGLAYSNGILTEPAEGRLRYYAERCPRLPQTLRFVIESLKEQRVDPAIAEYAVAQAFSSRAGGSYEGRTARMAADLVDGRGPDVVRRYRQAVLRQRKKPGLAELLEARKASVLGRVLPGYGEAKPETDGADFFVLGPEAQLTAWEDHLRSVWGPDTRVERLYPRDFWIPAPEYSD